MEVNPFVRDIKHLSIQFQPNCAGKGTHNTGAGGGQQINYIENIDSRG